MFRAACAWEDITYNLTRPLKTLRQEVNEVGRRWLRRTSAMAAKLTDHIWSIEEILTTVTGRGVAETVVMKEDVPEDVWLPPRHLVLVTNRPVRGKRAAQRVYEDWCQRGRIEPFYRFIQEDGVEVERFLVRRLERIRRMVLLVLMGALFILRLESLWPEVMIQWIRRLASSTGGTELDRGGPYLLLEGVRRVLGTFSLLQWMAKVPPPIPALPAPT